MNACDRLVQQLCLTETRAAVIHDPSNRSYLTGGFTGEGLLLITGTRRVVVTDFRSAEQARQQAPGFEVAVVREGSRGYHAELAALCRDSDVDVLLYEDDHVTVRDYQRLDALMGDNVLLVRQDRAVEKLRCVKDAREIARIRSACEVTVAAWEAALPAIHEGATEREVRVAIDTALIGHGAEARAFATIVAAGENGAMCHAVPQDRALKKGEMVTLDFGAKVGGYCADMTRTVAIGTPGDDMRRAYEAVRQVSERCLAALKPGVACAKIAGIAREHLDAAGYAGQCEHSLGHGLGLEVHEAPRLHQRSRDTLQPGMVVTVEPGIYLPGVGGVRIEDAALITEGGCEVLTKVPRELLIL